MPKLELFDDDYRLNEKGLLFYTECYSVIRPLFQRYVAEGYSPRELQYILTEIATDLGLTAVIVHKRK